MKQRDVAGFYGACIVFPTGAEIKISNNRHRGVYITITEFHKLKYIVTGEDLM